jgi:glycosyltransferase involved in cell wall biosynthesis
MNPKVSVCIVTYNHEKFISQALDSVLMQETDFDFEILIGEDDSDDKTRTIVKEYRQKYPKNIRLFLNDRSKVIYINGKPTGRWNFINNILHARGEYIALLEGDDYWKDPYKLQKQVDYMDFYPNFSTCFHWADWLVEETGEIAPWKYGPKTVKSYFTLDDLLRDRNFIPTCSAMFRNNIITKFPDWYYKVDIGDLPLHIMLAQYGQIGFIDSDMAVCRRHKGGMYGGNSMYDNLNTSLRAFLYTGVKLTLNNRNSFRMGLSNLYSELSATCKKNKKYAEAFVNGFKAIARAPRRYKLVYLKALLKNLLPHFYR